MYPIYKFMLSDGLVSFQAYPIYKDSLSKDFEKQQNQEFFRAKLSGDLVFESTDYVFIKDSAFDTRFGVEIFISYDGGTSWISYWEGEFWKTDCEFDEDSQLVKVKPTVRDQYTNVLAGIEKEYNLIELAPVITQVKADKRPMLQIYVPGQTTIGCILSGMWWEQECESITDEHALVYDYYFYKNKSYRTVEILGAITPNATGLYIGQAPETPTEDYTYTNGTYSFRYTYRYVSGQALPYQMMWEIVRDSDNVTLFQEIRFAANPPTSFVMQLTLSPIQGVSTGTPSVLITDTPIYARWICDVLMVGAVPTYPVPDDDICPDNRNYNRVVPYNDPSSIGISSRFSSEPTEWGIYQPGVYYLPPQGSVGQLWVPVARNTWSLWSIWFTTYQYDWSLEQSARAEFTIKYAYPISSVISVLLAQIDPNITHRDTTDYSEFLYGTNLIGVDQMILITPKSNIVTAGYDQPAQKAPVTLKKIMDMLRDCFRCYWFIDDDNHFRIEHIEFFRKGGSYLVDPTVGVDLTSQTVTRNGKAWSFGKNQYKFEKPSMASRYQFGWMDEVTQLFEGYPIDILSRYVNPDTIEQIEISGFTSDIDYILLNPDEISKDGFVLLSAVFQNDRWELPYMNFLSGLTDNVLQNAYVSFAFLQQYYAYDMPAYNYSINGENKTALGIKRLKGQEVQFPAKYDPNILKLIKTGIGNGNIEKVSVNLSSRSAKATLRYDTE